MLVKLNSELNWAANDIVRNRPSSLVNVYTETETLAVQLVTADYCHEKFAEISGQLWLDDFCQWLSKQNCILLGDVLQIDLKL